MEVSSRESYDAAQAEIARLNENKARLGAAYHALDNRCDRYRAALEEMVDVVTSYCLGVLTDEDEERVGRAIALIRNVS